MNRMTLLAAVIVVLSGLIGASPFIIDETSVGVYKENYNTSVNIVNDTGNDKNLGINSEKNLDFGEIPEGSNVTKFLNMSVKDKSILSMSAEGNISKFLSYQENMYFKGSKSIPLEMKGRDSGNYSGNLKLRFQVPENNVGRYWLDLKYEIYKLL